MELAASIEQAHLVNARRAYVVNMLGTWTNYMPSKQQPYLNLIERKKKKGIPYTETLGFVSEQVQNHQNQKAIQNPFEDHSENYAKPLKDFSSDCAGARHRLPDASATVINGVDVLGKTVNYRIAMGINEALYALYKGYQEINLIGHSRGAVECIIIAHELQRIQASLSDEIDTLEKFKEIYLRSPINNPNQGHLNINIWLNALISQDSAQLNPQEFKEFLTAFKQLRVNIFALDPVPGGEYRKWSEKSDWWNDHDRYLEIPKIVKEYFQILLENEHSFGFRTIFPNFDKQYTQYQILNLFGHHGSASGNPLNHEDKIPVQDGNVDDTRESQYIAMVHLIEFLEKNNVSLTPCTDTGIFLGAEFNKYLLAKRSERNDILLAYYEKMKAFEKSYKALELTSFIRITENTHIKTSARMFGMEQSGTRYAYKKQNKIQEVKIDANFPNYIHQNRPVINSEHALLKLGLPHDFDQDLTSSRLSKVLMDNLEAQDIENRYALFQKPECSKALSSLITELCSQVAQNQDNHFNKIYITLKKLVDCDLEKLNILECYLLTQTFELFKLPNKKHKKDANYEAFLIAKQIHLNERFNELKEPKTVQCSQQYKDLRFKFGELGKQYNDNYQMLRSENDDLIQDIEGLKVENGHLQAEIENLIRKYQQLENTPNQVYCEINHSKNILEIYSGFSLGSMLCAATLLPLIFLSAQTAFPAIIIGSSLLAISLILQMLVWNESQQIPEYDNARFAVN